ncbi:MAG TPA: ATP-binding protein [Kofleriaceae bacterium]|jgi:DNA gyrase subunit B
MRPADFRDSVRARPGMYVGDTQDGSGVLHMVLELVGNAIDQHWAGKCSRVDVAIGSDVAITVRDDGPGLAEPARYFERQSDRPTFDGHRPHVHVGLGLRGFGLFVVNALSERLGVSTVRDGVEARAVFERGELVEPWSQISTKAPSGTTIRFRVDPQLFGHRVPPHELLEQRLEELAHLLPTLDFCRNQTGVGLPGRVARRIGCAVGDVAHTREVIETPGGPIDVELALAFGQGETSIESFVNLSRTPDGGTHVDGLLAAIDEHRGGGLVGAASLILADVAFGGPTRDRLVTPAARDAVVAVAEKCLLARRTGADMTRA